MPELPDVVVYVEALERQLAGHQLQRVELFSPFVLRTVEPPVEAIRGRRVVGARRIGKRIALEFEGELFVVIHLMIAGRLRWREPGKKPGMGPKMILATFAFDHGTLFFSEAASKKRASIQMLQGKDSLVGVARGGIEPLEVTLTEFHQALISESHTVKRSLTDPRIISGIGNAYSDEILHAAKLSPLKLTRALDDDEVGRLYQAMRGTLEGLDPAAARRGQGGIPGEGDRLSSADGGPRPLQPAVSDLRLAGTADRLRRQRVQLLRAVPDQRASARRPVAVAAAQGRLAAFDRRSIERASIRQLAEHRAGLSCAHRQADTSGRRIDGDRDLSSPC